MEAVSPTAEGISISQKDSKFERALEFRKILNKKIYS